MKRYVLYLVILSFLLSNIVFSSKAFAINDFGLNIEVSQPTGEKFNITIIFFEDYTWYEADTGDIISKGEDEFWYYNVIDNNELTKSISKFKIDTRPKNAVTESELLKWREQKYSSSIKALSLNKSELNLTVGQMDQLTASIVSEVKPFLENSIIWSTDNSIVTIKPIDSYGTTALIKATSPGTAKIRATCKHDSSYYKECIVTVSEPPDDLKIDSRLNKAIVMLVNSNKAYVNGIITDIDKTNPGVTPVVKNNKTFVPLKFIAEKLGAKMEWSTKTSSAVIKIGKTTVKITLGSKTMLVGGKKQVLEAPAELINNNIYICIRDLSKLFGKKVSYDKELLIISETPCTIDRDLINKTIALIRSNSNTESALFPAALGGKWGYIDTNGKIVIEPQFQDAMGFSDGLAPVALNGKYGYIDKQGNFVVKPIYDRAWKMSDGMGMVLLDNKCGYIDRNGKLVIEPKYEFLYTMSFSEGLASVRINGKCGFIDKAGKLVIKPEYILALNFSEELAPVQDASTKKWGFVDKTGTYKIKPVFQFATQFKEGLAAVQDGDKEGKWGYIDKNGKYIIDPQFEFANSFKESMAQVKNKSGKYGYVDKKGKIIIDYKFDGASEFSEGLAAVSLSNTSSDNSMYGYINKKGETVIEFIYDYAENFNEGLAMVDLGYMAGYINKDGNYIWEPAEYPIFID